MKNEQELEHMLPEIVASFAEAWIEKMDNAQKYADLMVASFAEAWIENFLLNRLR